MSNSQARVNDVFAEASRLFANKNASYGDSWRDQGWRGNVSRVLEKAKRLRTLLWRPSVLLNGSKEHPRETMLDMINTLAFAIINMDDDVEWGGEVDGRPVQPLPPEWAREKPVFDQELEEFRASYGNPALTRADMERMKDAAAPPPYEKSGGVPEQRFTYSEGTTVPTEVVEGVLDTVKVPVPGEEKKPVGEGSGPRPTPNPRRKVGPRPKA